MNEKVRDEIGEYKENIDDRVEPEWGRKGNVCRDFAATPPFEIGSCMSGEQTR